MPLCLRPRVSQAAQATPLRLLYRQLHGAFRAQQRHRQQQGQGQGQGQQGQGPQRGQEGPPGTAAAAGTAAAGPGTGPCTSPAAAAEQAGIVAAGLGSRAAVSFAGLYTDGGLDEDDPSFWVGGFVLIFVHHAG